MTNQPDDTALREALKAVNEVMDAETVDTLKLLETAYAIEDEAYLFVRAIKRARRNKKEGLS